MSAKVRLPVAECGGINVAAFMDMLAYAEGTERYGADDGYNVIVGGSLFHDYADHPRKRIQLREDDPCTQRDESLASTAAGRYQFLARTWDDCRKRLGKLLLPDFSPASQDRACILLLRQCGAHSMLLANRFEDALNCARGLWASLPGAGYGQREVKADKLREIYIKAGGSV